MTAADLALYTMLILAYGPLGWTFPTWLWIGAVVMVCVENVQVQALRKRNR